MAELTRLNFTNFWQPNDRQEYAAAMARGRKNVRVNEAGIAVCSKCGAPVMFFLKKALRWLPCRCRCKDPEQDEDFKAGIAELKAGSGIEGRYAGADFEKFRVTEQNKAVFNSCLNYALHFKEIRDRGLGLYIYGKPGVGKTYLAACIGNWLLEEGIRVLLANVNTILSEIRYSYSRRGSELPIVQKYMNAPLVIFDDLGTEKYSAKSEALSFAQDKFFQIIDGRYTRSKPTIFTSNYTLQQLVSERGIMVKTVDRIAEMTSRKFELIGKAVRLERIADEKIPF